MSSRLVAAAKRAWLLIFLLFALGYVWQFFFRQAGQVQQPLHFSPGFILATLALQAVHWLAVSLLWRRMVSLSSPARVSAFQAFCQLVLVSVGKYLPGKVWGMVVRGAHLRRYGVDTGQALLATFHEQYFLLHGALVLSALLAAWVFRTEWAVLAALAALATLLLGAPLQRFAIRAFGFLARKLWRGGAFAPAAPVGLDDYLPIVAGYMGAWVANGLVFSGVYFTFFDAPIEPHLLGALILANTVGITVGFFALFAPGGIGVREAVTSGILGLVLPLRDAILLSLLFRLWLVATDLALGSAVILLLRKQTVSRP